MTLFTAGLMGGSGDLGIMEALDQVGENQIGSDSLGLALVSLGHGGELLDIITYGLQEAQAYLGVFNSLMARDKRSGSKPSSTARRSSASASVSRPNRVYAMARL